MKDFILKAESISKSYMSESEDSRLHVLDNVSLEIQKGTITSIVGSSGSGKSTLLHILGGLDKSDSGKVFWGDLEISSLNSDRLAEFRNKNVGFVFQFHHLLPEFSALENVFMPSLIGGNSMDYSKKRALELLDIFGIKERANHRPTQLSGGEQQRVSMARALMNNPQLILADEPTGNLDAVNTKLMLDELYKLRDEFNVTVLLITHEKAIAEKSDVILEIKNGTIVH